MQPISHVTLRIIAYSTTKADKNQNISSDAITYNNSISTHSTIAKSPQQPTNLEIERDKER